MVSEFRLCPCTESCGYKGLCLAQCSAAKDFKFLIIYEQCTSHFHFVLGPMDDVHTSSCNNMKKLLILRIVEVHIISRENEFG